VLCSGDYIITAFTKRSPIFTITLSNTGNKENMFKVNILRALSGIGQVIANRIWELRKEGHIDENILSLITTR
jgi:hypothetical protein